MCACVIDYIYIIYQAYLNVTEYAVDLNMLICTTVKTKRCFVSYDQKLNAKYKSYIQDQVSI